jgi:hypothetical protein
MALSIPLINMFSMTNKMNFLLPKTDLGTWQLKCFRIVISEDRNSYDNRGEERL